MLILNMQVKFFDFIVKLKWNVIFYSASINIQFLTPYELYMYIYFTNVLFLVEMSMYNCCLFV